MAGPPLPAGPPPGPASQVGEGGSGKQSAWRKRHVLATVAAFLAGLIFGGGCGIAVTDPENTGGRLIQVEQERDGLREQLRERAKPSRAARRAVRDAESLRRSLRASKRALRAAERERNTAQATTRDLRASLRAARSATRDAREAARSAASSDSGGGGSSSGGGGSSGGGSSGGGGGGSCGPGDIDGDGDGVCNE